MDATYSNNYQNPKTAAAYDEIICRSGEDPVWAVEQVLLRRLIKKHVSAPASAKTLDFACGTGRILEALKPVVGHVTGVDISAAMLERAATRVPGVSLVCTDVTAHPELLPADVDLITSFRFLLLAEPKLRKACISSLVGRLKAGSGVMILNSHGNPWSFRSIANMRDALLGRPRRLKAFSRSDMRELAEQCGLEVIDSAGCGHVPHTFHRILPAGAIRLIERAAARLPIVQRFGTNVVFVLRPVSRK